jgi:hypothetical protein
MLRRPHRTAFTQIGRWRGGGQIVKKKKINTRASAWQDQARAGSNGSLTRAMHFVRPLRAEAVFGYRQLD